MPASSHADGMLLDFSALNAIVAYLGLYLSAFVYVPFGELIMAWLGTTSLAQDVPRVSAEQAGLGPNTTVGHRAVVKTDRLVGQVFACKSFGREPCND